MYSSAKKVGVALSQPMTRRSRTFAPTRAARRGAARVPARARAARGARTRSAGRAATDTLSLSARDREALAGWLDAILLVRRLVGDEEPAVRALEAEVSLGLAEQLGGKRPAAVRAVDREGIAGFGRCRHPQPRLACCREPPAQDR